MKEITEKTVEQVEKGFAAFIEAANRSVAIVPTSSRYLAEDDRDDRAKHEAGFDHARNLLHATDLQHLTQIQNDYLKTQIAMGQAQMKQLGEDIIASARNSTVPKNSRSMSGSR